MTTSKNIYCNIKRKQTFVTKKIRIIDIFGHTVYISINNQSINL